MDYSRTNFNTYYPPLIKFLPKYSKITIGLVKMSFFCYDIFCYP